MEKGRERRRKEKRGVGELGLAGIAGQRRCGLGGGWRAATPRWREERGGSEW